MARTEQDEAYLMDLTVLLKALRETRQEATQVVQQLREQVEVCRALDARAATTLTQAVQQATASLQQAQERTQAQVAEGLQRAQAPLLHQWQQVVAQAARGQRWLPWKVGLLLGATLLVHAGGAAWWWGRLATERQEVRQELRQATALATELDRHLRETLYAQLSAPQKQAIEKIYRAHAVPPPSQRLP